MLACICGGIIEFVVGVVAVVGLGGSASVILGYINAFRGHQHADGHHHEH